MRPSVDIQSDVVGLWKAVFGEPPIVEMEATAMLACLVSNLPVAAYDSVGQSAPIADMEAPGPDPAPVSVSTPMEAVEGR